MPVCLLSGASSVALFALYTLYFIWFYDIFSLRLLFLSYFSFGHCFLFRSILVVYLFSLAFLVYFIMLLLFVAVFCRSFRFISSSGGVMGFMLLWFVLGFLFHYLIL